MKALYEQVDDLKELLASKPADQLGEYPSPKIDYLVDSFDEFIEINKINIAKMIYNRNLLDKQPEKVISEADILAEASELWDEEFNHQDAYDELQAAEIRGLII